jgi:hypothetical protein
MFTLLTLGTGFDTGVAPGSSHVTLRTAPKPEGPWSADTIVFSPTIASGGMVCAGVAHPYLDPSGKTLAISYTNFPKNIEAIRVIFN